MKLNALFSGFFFRLSLVILGGMVLITASPALQPIPHRDSGVFLYIGRGILLGKLPYLDFWDHKGPLIYYINALGLFFSANSYWGIWLVEFLFLTLTIYLSFSLMKDKFGDWIAFAGTALWLLALGRIFTIQFGAGNHVEEYALFFYVAQIYLFFQEDQRSQKKWKFFLIGVFAGMGILLRPNLSSPLLAIYLTMLWSIRVLKKDEKLGVIYNLARLTIGTVAPLAAVVIYFWHKQALQYLLDDALLYNFFYTGSGSLYVSAFTSSFNVLGLVNGMGALVWLLLIFFPNKMEIFTGDQNFNRFLALVFPVEIIFSLISGHGYVHYFISWLPLLGLSSCVFMQTARQLLEQKSGRFTVRYIRAAFILMIVAQAIPFGSDLRPYFTALMKNIKTGSIFVADENRSPEWDGIKQLYEIAPKGSEVIFWGNEVQYNFIMELPVPSRYLYVYPFLSPDYARLDMQQEFLTTLKTRQPILVDIQPSLTPPLKSLSKWSAYPKAMPFIRYVTQNYAIEREIEIISYYYADGQNWELAQKWIVWIHK